MAHAMELGGINLAKYPLQMRVSLSIADVKSYAWLENIELDWVSCEPDGETLVLCRNAMEAARFRTVLADALVRGSQ